MKIGIHMPAKIGDIIIGLPIAKYYADQGHDVFWSIDKNLIENFQDYVDYVTFIPIDASWFTYYDVGKKALAHCDKIFELTYRFPNFERTNNFHASGETFDKFRYTDTEVPFEEKWKLKINRNYKKEEELYQKIVKDKTSYFVQQLQCSDPFVHNFKFEYPKNANVINIEQVPGYTVFDWLTIFEKSQGAVLIDSCFANLLDQLNINHIKKYFIKRSDPVATPVLKKENNWSFL